MISLDNGFHEIVAIVRCVEEAGPRLAAALSFEQVHRGSPSPQVLEFLGLPSDCAAQEVVIGDPAQKRGFLRLMSFPDHPAPLRRDGGHAWDTGGIFDFNVRSLGAINAFTDRLNSHGFVPFAPTTHWQFGPLEVKEAVLTDADGICLAVMERLSPRLEGFDHVSGPTSYIFNSTQIVPDFDAARAFYVDHLGWQPFQETEWVHEDGKNCMGLPPGIAKTCRMRVGIYQQNGLNEGSVEILAMDVEGLDMSGGGIPQRGLATLRFPMDRPQKFLDAAAAGGCAITPLTQALIAPYGNVRIGSATTPWGVRLEVFSLV